MTRSTLLKSCADIINYNVHYKVEKMLSYNDHEYFREGGLHLFISCSNINSIKLCIDHNLIEHVFGITN